jgi:hypothetical protein
MITAIEQETSDIDWFFTNGEEVGFVASGGGKLPNSVSNKSIDEMALVATYFRDLPQKSGVTISPNLKGLILPGTDEKQYLSYFIEMAEKGLFSFDKTVLNRFSDTNYHLVAEPLSPLKLDDLPLKIAKVLAETKSQGAIETSLNIISFQ